MVDGSEGPAAEIQLQVLYWALAFAVALVGGLFKAVKLRGDVNRDWSSRLVLLEASLKDQALAELSRLRRQVDELVGGTGTSFSPGQAVADPEPLLKSVRRIARLLLAGKRARNCFRALRNLGTVMVVAQLLLLAGEVAGALHLSNLIDLGWWRIPAVIAAAVGVMLGIAAFIAYWVLHHRLSGAEILAAPESSDG